LRPDPASSRRNFVARELTRRWPPVLTRISGGVDARSGRFYRIRVRIIRPFAAGTQRPYRGCNKTGRTSAEFRLGVGHTRRGVGNSVGVGGVIDIARKSEDAHIGNGLTSPGSATPLAVGGRHRANGPAIAVNVPSPLLSSAPAPDSRCPKKKPEGTIDESCKPELGFDGSRADHTPATRHWH